MRRTPNKLICGQNRSKLEGVEGHLVVANVLVAREEQCSGFGLDDRSIDRFASKSTGGFNRFPKSQNLHFRLLRARSDEHHRATMPIDALETGYQPMIEKVHVCVGIRDSGQSREGTYHLL